MVRMKAEVKRLEEENETKRNSMDKIENEFNSLQGKVQNLDELNKLYTKDAVVLKETIKALEQSLDSERIKSGTVCRDNANFKQEKRRLQEQLSDVSRQSHHWQERARSFESEAWALKMDLDMKDTQINDVRILHESLRTEKAELASEKEALAAQLKELSDKLDQSDNDREELSKKIGQIKAQVNDQVGRVAELQVSLEATKKQHSTTEKELLKYQVKNAKRRREWANALYFLVNPFDAFRRSLMGPPERVQQFYRNQAPK
ncbi:rho-associated protein kinase 1-like [Folsomia candida]|nr:rho-associated protein kinase 1-like [Folsomia candida]